MTEDCEPQEEAICRQLCKQRGYSYDKLLILMREIIRAAAKEIKATPNRRTLAKRKPRK